MGAYDKGEAGAMFGAARTQFDAIEGFLCSEQAAAMSIRDLCSQQGVELMEGHAMPDHVHLCLSIPPKFSVANTVGFVKGKSVIRIHREYLDKQRNSMAYHFWARGYCVSTVGQDEDVDQILHPLPGRS